MPAPPPESEPAIVRHLGTTGDEASIAPVAIVTWDELLQGEELAYRTEIPARRADVVPIPDGLHPRVIDSLASLGREPVAMEAKEEAHLELRRVRDPLGPQPGQDALAREREHVGRHAQPLAAKRASRTS